MLDIYQEAAENNGTCDRRFKIKHAQHPRTNDIAFCEPAVIASMQPYQAIDGRYGISK